MASRASAHASSHQANVFGIGLRAADLHKAAAHLLEDEVVAEGFDGIQLAVVP